MKQTPDLRNLPKVPDNKPEKPAKLPTLKELFFDDPEYVKALGKVEGLNSILNVNPPAKWIKKHPFLDNHLYLPIDKVEYLLRKIFKRYSVVITGQGTAFNGVWVTVRVSYFNPATGQMEAQDGIGAAQLQTAKGTSPADLANINNGAISMAFPIAKTLAVKDACDMIGNIFGANLNRKDILPFTADQELVDRFKNAVE